MGEKRCSACAALSDKLCVEWHVIHSPVTHRLSPPLVQRAQGRLSTDLMHRPLVGFFRDKTLILGALWATYMWISGRLAATMAAVFASPAFNLGDIRVSGTLAAVRGAFAR